jgi:hypothetical protein
MNFSDIDQEEFNEKVFVQDHVIKNQMGEENDAHVSQGRKATQLSPQPNLDIDE